LETLPSRRRRHPCFLNGRAAASAVAPDRTRRGADPPASASAPRGAPPARLPNRPPPFPLRTPRFLDPDAVLLSRASVLQVAPRRRPMERAAGENRRPAAAKPAPGGRGARPRAFLRSCVLAFPDTRLLTAPRFPFLVFLIPPRLLQRWGTGGRSGRSTTSWGRTRTPPRSPRSRC
jgi:hypothetical protein